MKDAVVEYEILNWDKFNPPKYEKKMIWFRVDADMPISASISRLDDKMFRVWFTLLARACKGRGKGQLGLMFLCAMVHTKVSKASSCLKKLQALEMIRYRIKDVETPSNENSLLQTDRQTLQTDVTDVTDSLSPTSQQVDEEPVAKPEVETAPTDAEVPPVSEANPPTPEPQPERVSEGEKVFDDRFPADCSPDELQVLRYASEKLERVLGSQEMANFLETWRKHPTFPKTKLLSTIDWLSGHPKALKNTHSVARLFYENAIRKEVAEFDATMWQTISRDKSAGISENEIVARFIRGNPNFSAKALRVYCDRIFSRFSSA